VAAEGAALAGQKRFDQADALLLASFEVLGADSGALTFFTNNTARWLANLYESQGDTEKATHFRTLLAM